MLRTRLPLLVSAAMSLLWIGLALMLWQHDQRFETRYAKSLMLAQDIAWKKIQSRKLQILQEHALALLADRELADALTRQDQRSANDRFEHYASEHPELRIDAYTPNHSLLFTSSAELEQRALLDAGGLNKLLLGQPLSGVGQIDAMRYQILIAQPLHSTSSTVGVLALSFPIDAALDELKQHLGADAYLLNLRGRMTHGTDHWLWRNVSAHPSLRTAGVQRVVREGQVYLAVSLPVRNPDGRVIGALVTLRDYSQAAADDRFFTLAWAGGGALMAVLITLGLFLYVRRSLQPLTRVAAVINALAHGDTEARLAESDEELPDEAGEIARGVAVLREELLKLEMLRDERVRQRQRQEKLIREQLFALAVNLDSQVRADILSDLDAALDSARAGQEGNQLSALADILGRLSALVTNQQRQLLQLVDELRLAMETKARLASLQQELEIARQMQQSILPRALPPRAEISIAATMIPAKEVGGDFYDYFLLDEHHLGVVVADVSGKGVPAALFMAISRSLLKAYARFFRSPAACLGKLNQLLASENEQMMFVTVFYGVLDLVSGEFVFLNAGHNPPLLQRADGTLEWLPKTEGMALAVVEDFAFGDACIRLTPGDTLVMFTDGVTEAVDEHDRLFGEARLMQAMAQIGPTEAVDTIPERLVEAVRDFAAGTPQSDDITCVVMRYGEQVAKPSSAEPQEA
ncbi:PP2C family protein-serine/threonine phosphatase [Chitinimonas lacunae]|uniref:PP2C family protein-serine/threonine phosphatase n=1 Tax=Chitinimonas lacunae TaxID=1963018 RepID=A0ABV8MSE1_9NEIS